MQESLRIVLFQRLNALLAVAVTLAASIAAGWIAGDHIDGRIRRDMGQRVPVAGLVLLGDLDPHAQSGTEADLGKPAYLQIRERARRLCLLNPIMRSMSVLRVPEGGGPYIYLFDFRVEGSDREARPGDVYLPREGSSGLRNLLEHGRVVLEGPLELAGAEGTRGLAYAFVNRFDTAVRNDARHVIRVEADASGWRQSVTLAALIAGLATCGLLGIPLAMLLFLQRERVQSAVIRNLSEAVEQANSGVLILDPSGRIEYGNEIGARHVGVSRRALIGRGWREFFAAADDSPSVNEIAGGLAAGVAWQGEWVCRRSDGFVFPVRGGFSPVRRRNQRVAAFVVVFDDVTELRRREDELREATEQARAADRAKGHFLATISHEVRTPLNGIVGFTGLLLETPLSAVQREHLLTIRSSADSLVRLTADILDFAGIESGKARIEPAPGDPRECLEEALELHTASAAAKGLQIFHRIAPDVPSSIVTDHGRLRQVLVNLVGNAVKFTEQGEVEVTVSISPEQADDRGVVLEFMVRDTGPGISPENQARLFRPFTQLENSNTRRHGGAGLGLAISRNLAQMLGGDIRVVSRGAGTTFTLSIRAPIDRPARGPRLGKAVVAVVGGAGGFRSSLASMIRGWGAEVHEVDAASPLPARGWTAIVRDLDEAEARRLASAPDLVTDGASTIALVPLVLDGDLKSALRPRFRTLLSKPVRSTTLLSMLTGSGAVQPASASRSRFGFRVLVAEDNAVNQRLIRLMLENFGCATTVVGNGREAIAALVAAPGGHDLILLDMHMPEIDGLGVLRAIRSGEAGPAARDLWVVALSADVRSEQRAAAAAAGLDEYLVKPVSLRAMEEMLLRFECVRLRPPA